jgi:hypothetical protein
MPGERPRRRLWGWLAPLALLAGAGLGGWLVQPRDGEGAGAAVPRPPAAGPAASSPASRVPYSSTGAQAKQAQHQLWQQRLERAQQVLDTYRASTRYPHGSRPAAEQSDQLRPNDPVVEDHALAEPGKPAAEGLKLRTMQERIHAQGSEAVRFSVAVVDAEGRSVPLRVLNAAVHEVTPPTVASLYPVLPVAFNDDGTGGDTSAGDGVHTARLQPAEQGYAGLAGQLRLQVLLDAGGRRGQTYFDLYVTPDPPAVWAGAVRDTVEAGSLVFVLPAEVREPGRYVVSGRVDDAVGRPIALLTSNDELPAGAAQVALQLHGRLLHDLQPAFPLTLRDVDAFRLREQGHPDRALMARRIGPVHVSASHALAAFSSAEWASEERSRYLAELTRDVDEARAKVEQYRPGP